MARLISTRTFTTPPVVGQRVEGTTVGMKNGKVDYRATWDGIYQGVRPSEHTGEPIHFLTDGHINGLYQATQGFPVNTVITED